MEKLIQIKAGSPEIDVMQHIEIENGEEIFDPISGKEFYLCPIAVALHNFIKHCEMHIHDKTIHTQVHQEYRLIELYHAAHMIFIRNWPDDYIKISYTFKWRRNI